MKFFSLALLVLAHAATSEAWFFSKKTSVTEAATEAVTEAVTEAETEAPTEAPAEDAPTMDLGHLVGGAYEAIIADNEESMATFAAESELSPAKQAYTEGINDSMITIFHSLASSEIGWSQEALLSVTMQLRNVNIGFPLLIQSLEKLATCGLEEAEAVTENDMSTTEGDMDAMPEMGTESSEMGTESSEMDMGMGNETAAGDVASRMAAMDRTMSLRDGVVGRFVAIAPLITGMSSLPFRAEALFNVTSELVEMGRLTEAQQEDILDGYLGELDAMLNSMATNSLTGGEDEALLIEMDAASQAAYTIVQNVMTAAAECSAADMEFSYVSEEAEEEDVTDAAAETTESEA